MPCRERCKCKNSGKENINICISYPKDNGEDININTYEETLIYNIINSDMNFGKGPLYVANEDYNKFGTQDVYFSFNNTGNFTNIIPLFIIHNKSDFDINKLRIGSYIEFDGGSYNIDDKVIQIKKQETIQLRLIQDEIIKRVVISPDNKYKFTVYLSTDDENIKESPKINLSSFIYASFKPRLL